MLQHWNSLEDIWERKNLKDIWDNELLTKRPNRLTRSHLAEALPSFTWWHYLMFYHRDHFFNRPLLETRKKRACWLISPTKMAIQVITRATFISINVIPGFVRLWEMWWAVPTAFCVLSSLDRLIRINKLYEWIFEYILIKKMIYHIWIWYDMNIYQNMIRMRVWEMWWAVPTVFCVLSSRHRLSRVNRCLGSNLPLNLRPN